MNIEEFQNQYEKSYHFFLSELKNISDKDLSYIIELMRAAQHTKDFQKLMIMIKMIPEGLGEYEQDIYWVNNDSLITLVLNISAAQLRESLKLFWNFSKTSFFKEIYEILSEDKRKDVDLLKALNDEYSKKKGFICDVLGNVRNLMFHYLPDKSIYWIKEMKEMELEEKPSYQSVNLEAFDFGPGAEYDREIYSKYLFWGDDGSNSLMKYQKKVWDTQSNFLNSVKNLVEAILIKEKIPKRKYGWSTEYFYGYK